MRRPIQKMKQASVIVSTPCALCPFRRDVEPYITRERVESIWQAALRMGEHFVCHETVNYDDRSKDTKRRGCAGFMLLAQREGADQGLVVVQLAERLAGLKFRLRGADRVYPSISAMLKAHSDPKKKKGRG